jgi:hypothetical protein
MWPHLEQGLGDHTELSCSGAHAVKELSIFVFGTADNFTPAGDYFQLQTIVGLCPMAPGGYSQAAHRKRSAHSDVEVIRQHGRA